MYIRARDLTSLFHLCNITQFLLRTTAGKLDLGFTKGKFILICSEVVFQSEMKILHLTPRKVKFSN